MNKICGTCQILKPLTDFNKNKCKSEQSENSRKGSKNIDDIKSRGR